MVKDILNKTMKYRRDSPYNPLQQLVDKPPLEEDKPAAETETKPEKAWSSLSIRARQEALAHVEFYLENFIGVIQGVP